MLRTRTGRYELIFSSFGRFAVAYLFSGRREVPRLLPPLSDDQAPPGCSEGDRRERVRFGIRELRRHQELGLFDRRNRQHVHGRELTCHALFLDVSPL